jgi:hypothetical protein
MLGTMYFCGEGYSGQYEGSQNAADCDYLSHSIPLSLPRITLQNKIRHGTLSKEIPSGWTEL